MNATQKNYLKDRIRDIARRKEQATYEWFENQLTYKDAVEQEIRRQIKSGEAKLRADQNIPYISNYLILNEKKIQKVRDKDTAERKKFVKVRDDKGAKIRQEMQRIMDEIMLGDETKALEMLRKFEQLAI